MGIIGDIGPVVSIKVLDRVILVITCLCFPNIHPMKKYIKMYFGVSYLGFCIFLYPVLIVT